MRKIMFAIFIFSLSIIAVAVSGKVIRVSDGDTILIQSGSQKIRVRMYGIDAPELKQKYGEESKKYLEKRIMDKNVDIKVINQDQYGRKVGKVFYKNKDIGKYTNEKNSFWILYLDEKAVPDETVMEHLKKYQDKLSQRREVKTASMGKGKRDIH